MQLSELQLATQELIIQKIHGCSLEEARKKEQLLGCIFSVVETFGPIYGKVILYEQTKYLTETTIQWYNDGVVEKTLNISGYTIIGLAPTLQRVLTALGIIKKLRVMYVGYSIRGTDLKWICDRKLLNEDLTDATLRDQSEETQEKIYNLMKNK